MENKYNCETCGKSFDYSSSCKRHIKEVHNNPSYICDVCNAKFKCKRYLDDHKRMRGCNATSTLQGACSPDNSTTTIGEHPVARTYNFGVQGACRPDDSTTTIGERPVAGTSNLRLQGACTSIGELLVPVTANLGIQDVCRPDDSTTAIGERPVAGTSKLGVQEACRPDDGNIRTPGNLDTPDVRGFTSHPAFASTADEGNSSADILAKKNVEKHRPAVASTSRKDPVTNVENEAGVKTEDTASWFSESLSSEDSSHSELVHSADPLALEDDLRPGTSSTVDIASLPGTSSTGLDPFPMPSSSSTPPPPPPPSQRLEMPPPRLAPSRGASPALRSTSVTESLPLPQQKTGGQKKTLEENVVSSDLGVNEFDDALLETNQLDAALQRLECISEKVDELGGRDDNFDSFGKYVASLLRGLPTHRAVNLQQEVINLILRSHINREIRLVDSNSAPSSSVNVVPSTLTPETVRTMPQPQPPSLPPPPLTPLTQTLGQSKQASSTLQSISVGKSMSVPQQSRKGEKRPLSDDASSSEVGNKQFKLDDPILDTEQIDATLKKLEEISDKVNQLNEKDDNFDNFGKYAASLLRCLPPQRAIELQREVVNLILREHGGSTGSTPQEVRLYVKTNTGVS